MNNQGLLFQAFIYLSAAIVAVPLAKRLGLGSVLGYLIAGAVIGPHALQLVGSESKDVMHFAEFGVVMMLFLIGLELEPRLLWRLRAPILGMGSLQLLATAVCLGALALSLGVAVRAAIAIGLILALSSTAIVLQTLNEKGLMRTDAGQRSFAVLLLQDLAVIPLLAIMPLLGAGPAHGAGSQDAAHGASWVAGLPGWAQALAVLSAVVAVLLVGRFVVSPAFRLIARAQLRELFTAGALLLVIGIALLMDHVGLSPALGTFLAGVVLASSEYRHELESDIEPLKGLLLGLFFISVGAAVDLQRIAHAPLMLSGLTGSVVATKFLVLFVLGRCFRMSTDQLLLFAVALSQGGEFAFVLFSFAQNSGVLSEAHTATFVAVIALSMATTPLLLLLHEKLLSPHLGVPAAVAPEADELHEDNRVIIAGFGRFGSIVGRLLRANGVSATVLDVDSDHVDLLRRLGFRVFYGDASRVDLLHAAGALRARVLVIAVDNPERILTIAKQAKHHFPNLTILARAVSRTHAYELFEAGVTHVFRETFETSLRVGVAALTATGLSPHQAHRAAQTFRRHDERSLRELGKLRHEKDTYMSEARRSIEALETVLKSELSQHERLADLGWDAESLRNAR